MWLILLSPHFFLFRELNISEKKFKSLFEEMISGVALHEIICVEKGKPINYRFLNANSAFEKMTGLKEKHLIGKSILEVLPNTEPRWIETYGQVALTGSSVRFENYSAGFNKHFEVSAYCPKYGQFVAVFNDITEKKNSGIEKDKFIGELQKAASEIKTLRGILPICAHCKKIRDDQGYWSQIEAYIEAHSDKKLLVTDPEVKAIVSSGYSDDPVLANFQEYGFKDMMPKPFESRSLGKVLHEVLKCEND